MSLVCDANQSDDEQFFVTEILALLDFDDDSWPAPNSPDEPLGCVRKPKFKKLRPHPDTVTEVKSKKSKPPTTPRLRNKAKIELLRHEIKALEAVLASLQHSKRGAVVPEQRRVESLWRIIAMRQKYKREQAEFQNMKLKKMIAEQNRLTGSLCSALDEWKRFPAPDLTFNVSSS
ncbi:hypothetical protein PRIC1_012593 [Phytophthora ramorum]